MKQPVIVFKHQKKLADSLDRILKDKRAKHPVQEAPTTFTASSIHVSHRLAKIKAKKKNNG